MKKKKGRGGPEAKPISKHIVETVVSTAMACPWYGYKKIAVNVINLRSLESKCSAHRKPHVMGTLRFAHPTPEFEDFLKLMTLR